jgi:hypothetical protein
VCGADELGSQEQGLTGSEVARESRKGTARDAQPDPVSRPEPVGYRVEVDPHGRRMLRPDAQVAVGDVARAALRVAVANPDGDDIRLALLDTVGCYRDLGGGARNEQSRNEAGEQGGDEGRGRRGRDDRRGRCYHPACLDLCTPRRPGGPYRRGQFHAPDGSGNENFFHGMFNALPYNSGGDLEHVNFFTGPFGIN